MTTEFGQIRFEPSQVNAVCPTRVQGGALDGLFGVGITLEWLGDDGDTPVVSHLSLSCENALEMVEKIMLGLLQAEDKETKRAAYTELGHLFKVARDAWAAGAAEDPDLPPSDDDDDDDDDDDFYDPDEEDEEDEDDEDDEDWREV